VLEYAEEHPDDYIVQADVASFFISVRSDELERRLLEAGSNASVVRDLQALLTGWHAEGIQGLPQGLLPSSILGNFYLTSVDQALRARGTRFWRYMDDMAVAASGFHAGRQVLDQLEGALYADGLILGATKTKVIRATSAGDEFQTMRERLNEQFEEFLGELGDYAPGDEEAGELRQEQIRGLFDDAVQALHRDEFRRGEFTVALQELGRVQDGHALPELPYVLLRLPGLTKAVSSYMADVTGPANRGALVAALESIVLEERFHRPQEWLHILRGVMVAGDQVAPTLVPKLEELAACHEHPLVRCRALLAWGRQSPLDDFDAADEFFRRERRDRLGYALVAIQAKATEPRNSRYESWSSEGRSLANLANSLRGRMLAWHSI
jgi:Reverse transcriptase (RNA-dependent DNA polymerase)